MKGICIHFREHFFFYILLLLVIIIGIVSYYRFVINYDYIVSYEGVCEPSTESCFIGCEDDSCTEEYYYSKVQKYAPDLYNECGLDITDCEEANICLPNDRECSVTYCDTEIDGKDCETLTEESDAQDSDQIDSTEEESLQNDNANNTNI